MEMKWFTIFTRPDREMSVSKALTRKKITNYCPLKKVILKNKGVKYNGEVPLFKSYVFVKFDESRLNELKLVNGVLSFLYCMNKPVIMHESEIVSIIQFMKEHAEVRIEKVRLGTQGSGQASKDALKNAAARLALPSLSCNIISEAAPEVIKPRSSLYVIKSLKIRPQYTLKALLLICVKLLSDL